MSNELIIKVDINNTNGYKIDNIYLYGANVTVDWGDESPTSSAHSQSVNTLVFNHEYYVDGEYTITITGATGIYNHFLEYMENVVEVIIPNNITSLPNCVLDGCINLEKVTLPNGISTIGTNFARYTNIDKLILPESLTSIGVYFLHGSNLEEVILPYGISEIPDDSFGFMSELTNIRIPNSVTTIGDAVLFNCDNLPYIEIPKSVETIGEDFLSGCDSNPLILKFKSETPPSMGAYLLSSVQNYTIHVPEGSIMNYVNESGYPSNQSKYVEYPTLKYKLETLGKLMASNLTKQFVTASWDEGLTTLANKVSDIQDFNDIFDFDSSNDYASNGVSVMYNYGNQPKSYFTLKIPPTITTLGDESFNYYGSMKICEIPSSVTSIGNYVFNLNQSLEKIIFKGTTPQTATSKSSFVTNSNSTQNIPTTCVIEVPCSALSAYKSATNYPDPTVYTYQCIRFDEKCDSSPVNSNISPPILVYGSTKNGVQSIVYNSQENAYELSGSGSDSVILPINGLSGITDIEFSCEVKIPYPWNGVWIGLGATPPESGIGQTINDTYADVVYVRALDSNGKTDCTCKKTMSSTTSHQGSITVDRSNMGWIRIILNFASSNTLTARVEELDGTELATFSKTVSSQVSDRHYGIYYRDNGNTSVKTYIRNIKCIGY